MYQLLLVSIDAPPRQSQSTEARVPHSIFCLAIKYDKSITLKQELCQLYKNLIYKSPDYLGLLADGLGMGCDGTGVQILGTITAVA